MQTKKPNKIELSQQEKKKQVEKIIKEAKKQNKVKQVKWEKYSDEEVKQIVKGRTLEFLQLQRDFRYQFFKKLTFEAELDVMIDQLQKIKKGDKPDMLWQGMPIPESVLKSHIMLHQNNLHILLTELNNSRDKLKKFGLTDADLQEIIQKGKYFKELKDEKNSISRNNEE